jgi:hypothetical protein
VPVATSYPHIAPIEEVGERTLEIGDLGGDFGDFGIANEDVRMCRGGTCDSELCSLHTSDWCQGSLEVSESFHVALSHLSRYGTPFLCFALPCAVPSPSECRVHSLTGAITIVSIDP